MTFSKLVSQIIDSEIGMIEEKSCPDQYVGEIFRFSSNQIDFPVRISAERSIKRPNSLIMVIESPHVNEFANDPGPAKGHTGNQIRKWITKVNGLSQYSNHGLIIVNAVQYQCSLGQPTKCFRDDIFNAVWNSGGEDDFMTRLKAVYRKSDIVVNCCTKGSRTVVELRKLVQQAIAKINFDSVVLKRTHPASWYAEKNRKHEW